MAQLSVALNRLDLKLLYLIDQSILILSKNYNIGWNPPVEVSVNNCNHLEWSLWLDNFMKDKCIQQYKS